MKMDANDNNDASIEKKKRDWKIIIMHHIAAWTVLILFSFWIWSMIKPVLPETPSRQGSQRKGEYDVSTSTVSSITGPQTIPSNQAAKIKKVTPPVVVNTTVPVVTTTVPIAVNGAKVVNPLLGTKVKRVRIIVNGLNVRAKPNAAGAVIGALRRNEVVKVLGYQGDWLYIGTNKNVYGFIKADTKFEKPDV
jgi:cytoskeletal protein RodZ